MAPTTQPGIDGLNPKEVKSPPSDSFLQQHARLWMALLLCLTDLTSLSLAGMGALGLRRLIGPVDHLDLYWNLTPIFLIFLTAYALRGLYPAVGLSPVEELSRLSTAITVVSLFAIAFTFFIRSAEFYSRLAFAFFWILALFMVPLGRWIVRVVAVQLNLWGESVAVVGSGVQTQHIVEFLLKRMRFGLRLVTRKLLHNRI